MHCNLGFTPPHACTGWLVYRIFFSQEVDFSKSGGHPGGYPDDHGGVQKVGKINFGPQIHALPNPQLRNFLTEIRPPKGALAFGDSLEVAKEGLRP